MRRSFDENDEIAIVIVGRCLASRMFDIKWMVCALRTSPEDDTSDVGGSVSGTHARQRVVTCTTKLFCANDECGIANMRDRYCHDTRSILGGYE
jgi:hypothetical protein